jgi:hypothetical protein
MDEQVASTEALSRKRAMIRRLPSRYAPFIYGIIQAWLTTGVATALATLRVTGFSAAWIGDWVTAC